MNAFSYFKKLIMKIILTFLFLLIGLSSFAQNAANGGYLGPYFNVKCNDCAEQNDTINMAFNPGDTIVASVRYTGSNCDVTIVLGWVWYKNDQLISPTKSWETFSSRGSELIMIEPGQYKVNAMGGKRIINVNNNTGLTNSSKTPIHLYPNPATEKISINESSKVKYYEIHNMLGIIVYKGFYEEGGVNIEELSSGNYFIRAEFEDGKNGYGKFVKE
jgi:hypothetical protein